MAEKSPRGNVLTVETRSVVLNIRIKPSLKGSRKASSKGP